MSEVVHHPYGEFDPVQIEAKYGAYPEARTGRENLAQGLADLEPQQWILLEDFFKHLFARAFLLEYAATLGSIDVALIPPWGAVSDVRNLWGADDLSCLSR
ncbi:MAG: hypothetical protein R6V55_14475 [Desulfovermiculus sp.]